MQGIGNFVPVLPLNWLPWQRPLRYWKKTSWCLSATAVHRNSSIFKIYFFFKLMWSEAQCLSLCKISWNPSNFAEISQFLSVQDGDRQWFWGFQKFKFLVASLVRRANKYHCSKFHKNQSSSCGHGASCSYMSASSKLPTTTSCWPLSSSWFEWRRTMSLACYCLCCTQLAYLT